MRSPPPKWLSSASGWQTHTSTVHMCHSREVRGQLTEAGSVLPPYWSSPMIKFWSSDFVPALLPTESSHWLPTLSRTLSYSQVWTEPQTLSYICFINWNCKNLFRIMQAKNKRIMLQAWFQPCFNQIFYGSYTKQTLACPNPHFRVNWLIQSHWIGVKSMSHHCLTCFF